MFSLLVRWGSQQGVLPGWKLSYFPARKIPNKFLFPPPPNNDFHAITQCKLSFYLYSLLVYHFFFFIFSDITHHDNLILMGVQYLR